MKSLLSAASMPKFSSSSCPEDRSLRRPALTTARTSLKVSRLSSQYKKTKKNDSQNRLITSNDAPNNIRTENVQNIYLVRVNKIPFRRTKRVQKYLEVSRILDAPSILGLASTLAAFVESFASTFPLPLPVGLAEDSLTARTLASTGS